MPQSLGFISVDGKNPWILDSRAIDHLTGSSEHFISYAPCAGNEKIQIADGSLASIASKGQIVSFDGFALQNVFHVPKLSYNLLSINKITRELHCKAIFLLESVYFQNISSGRMIDTARHSRGLYILDDDTSCSSFSKTSLLSSTLAPPNKIVCCDIFGWATQTLHICNIYFPIFFLNLMSLLYLVMCVSRLNNIGSLFPHNHINLHNHLSSSIVTFEALPRSPLPPH
ncbi:hypothetical protein IC582_027520 [Cucumis melo]